jgi:hypothetical protein
MTVKAVQSESLVRASFVRRLHALTGIEVVYMTTAGPPTENYQYVFFIVESLGYARAMAQSLSHAEAAASDVLSATRRHYCGAGDII